MQERYLGRIRPDMDVCDVGGEKVGTVAHVYRHADAVVISGTSTAPGEQPLNEEIIEVKTGFLGLGSHLYIPLSAVQETLEGSVFLSKRKEEFDQLGWHDKPAYLDELT